MNNGAATFTATVSSSSTPTGNVQFAVNGVNYGGPVTLISGVATIADANLTPGAYNISAVYPPQGNFLTSSANLGNITTFAGNEADGAGYSGDNGQATQAQLSSPTSVAFDHSGDKFIADTGNNVIREVTPDGTTITTVSTAPLPLAARRVWRWTPTATSSLPTAATIAYSKSWPGATAP